MTEQGSNLHVKTSLMTWSHCLTLDHPNLTVNRFDSYEMVPWLIPIYSWNHEIKLNLEFEF